MPELTELRRLDPDSLELESLCVLRPGQPRAPFMLGTLDTVRVSGAGRHRARAYFDGQTLFMASVSVTEPVIVNEAALSELWAPLFYPSHVRLGSALLEYVAADAPAPSRKPAEPADPWGGHTVLMSAPATKLTLADARRGQLAPGVGFEAETVVGPAPSLELAKALSEAPAVTPAPIAPASLPPTAESLSTAELAARTLPGSAWQRLRDEFRRTPRAIRGSFFALPIVAWAALGSPSESAAPEASRSVSASASASASPSDAPKASALGASARPDIEPARSTEPKVGLASVMRGKRTLEASAADAAARGAFAESAAMYGELARLAPNRPEFASAALILGKKRPSP